MLGRLEASATEEVHSTLHLAEIDLYSGKHSAEND